MTEPGVGLSRLWVPSSAPRPGPRPRLSAAAIVQAALEVVGSEGIDAITMSRVAEVVGCSKMALYRHLSDRNDLLAMMADAAIGSPPPAAADDDWRDQFIALWDALLAVYAENSWLLDLPDKISGLTPHNLDWLDAGLAIIRQSTLPLADHLNTILLITENIRFEARRRRSVAGRVNDLDFMLMAGPGASAELPVDRYPNLMALVRRWGAGNGSPAESADGTRTMILTALAVHFPGK